MLRYADQARADRDEQTRGVSSAQEADVTALRYFPESCPSGGTRQAALSSPPRPMLCLVFVPGKPTPWTFAESAAFVAGPCQSSAADENRPTLNANTRHERGDRGENPRSRHALWRRLWNSPWPRHLENLSGHHPDGTRLRSSGRRAPSSHRRAERLHSLWHTRHRFHGISVAGVRGRPRFTSLA